jgi:hypothetical protein
LRFHHWTASFAATAYQRIEQKSSRTALQGAFVAIEAGATVLAILDATGRFYHPLHVGEWKRPDVKQN